MKYPKITINCAMSADGKIALPWRKQIRLSSDEDIIRVHQLRHNSDAILVGIGTILADNPKLTVKKKFVRNPGKPLRVVLDRYGQTPTDALILNEAAPTLIITQNGYSPKFSQTNVEVHECPIMKNGYVDLHYVLELLYTKGIQHLLVEGGGTIIWNFIQNRLVDTLYLYIAPVIIGGDRTPTVADGKGINSIDELIFLEMVDYSKLGNGILICYKPVNKKSNG